jgi:DNA-binding CsgD family transcriptional regulator
MSFKGKFDIGAIAASTATLISEFSKVKSPAELAAIMSALAGDLGIRHFALIHHTDLRDSPANFVNIKDYPAGATARIVSEGRYRRDPIIRACAFAERAFLWSEIDRLIKLSRHDRDCLRAGTTEGLNEGITVPCALLGECMGSCTFAGFFAPERAQKLLGAVQIIGVFAFQAARRVVSGPRPAAPLPRLHPRPRDCVVLAGRGLSNKEIARALGITPRTVDGYLTEARQLFDAHDRTELVISALFAGEIGLGELRPGQPEHPLGLRQG